MADDITERERAEEKLRKSEEKYRTLFDSIDEGYALVELVYDDAGKPVDYRILEANPVWRRQTGLENPAGRFGSEIAPDTGSYWLESFDKAARTGEPQRTENYHAPTGHWYSTYSSRVGTADRRQVAVIFDDITERKHRERNLAFLAHIENQFASLTSSEEITKVAGASIAEHFNISHCLLVDINEQMSVASVFHDHRATAELPSLVGDYVLEDFHSAAEIEQLASGQPVVINDVLSERHTPESAANFDALGTRALVTAPYVRDGHWKFALGAQVSQPRRWRKDETEFLAELATRVALRIARARAEEALRESHERRQFVLGSAKIGEWELDLATGQARRSFIHDQCFGASEPFAEWSYDIFLSYVHPDDRPDVERKFGEAIRERKAWAFECRVVWADASVHWIQAIGYFYRDGGETPSRMVGIVSDITLRKQAEEALRESEERFRAIFEQASVGIVLTNTEGDMLMPNGGFCKIIGYSEEEARRLKVADVTHPEDYPREAELTRQLIAGEILGYSIEKRYVRTDGVIVWGTMTATLIRSADAPGPFALAIVEDISERKATEAALRESENRFRTLADAVPQIIWRNDAEGDATYFNRRWFEYSGLSYEESHGPGWQAIVHPDDAPGSVARWEQAVAAGEVFDCEYRLRRADGEYRWFIGRNVPLKNDSGEVEGWFGSATDIHDVKVAEHARGESEERFRLLVEGARDYAMFLLDLDNRITYWSRGAERIFGWSRDEAEGQFGDLIFIEEDKRKGEVEKEVAAAMQKGRAPDRRWHCRQNRSRLWVDGVLMRLDHADGSPRGFAKIARDASDHKEAEEALRHARDEMEQRVVDRTAQLIEINRRLEHEAARRQRLEREILEVTERERVRISQDLHDSLCQELTATAFLLKSRAKGLGHKDPEVGEALTESAEMVNRNAGMARDLARGLHPLELGSGGLISALRELASRTSQVVNCKCECPRSLRVPNETVAVNLYRIAQEAVTNAIKHAKPSEIVIRIERQKDEIHLMVTDNGTP
ncbi:MAG TPA: PAS domain S-box protein, partial [Chthoniobacterales bacterium]|nr:PAS domain S-box protein [Chthoniobacterales bacterium]